MSYSLYSSYREALAVASVVNYPRLEKKKGRRRFERKQYAWSLLD